MFSLPFVCKCHFSMLQFDLRRVMLLFPSRTPCRLQLHWLTDHKVLRVYYRRCSGVLILENGYHLIFSLLIAGIKKGFNFLLEPFKCMNGVSDGTRTHDLLDHNQGLPPAELRSPYHDQAGQESKVYNRYII